MSEKKNDGTHVPTVDAHIAALTRPAKGQKFLQRDVHRVGQEVLHAFLQEKKYVAEEAMTWSKQVCQEMQKKVGAMGYERYKIVVQCTITEAAGQGLRISSRCLWDPETDNYAEIVLSNEHLHCVLLVFGVYWE